MLLHYSVTVVCITCHWCAYCWFTNVRNYLLMGVPAWFAYRSIQPGSLHKIIKLANWWLTTPYEFAILLHGQQAEYTISKNPATKISKKILASGPQVWLGVTIHVTCTHTWQTYGFTPEWMRKCCDKYDELAKHLPHVWHLYGLVALPWCSCCECTCNSALLLNVYNSSNHHTQVSK